MRLFPSPKNRIMRGPGVSWIVIPKDVSREISDFWFPGIWSQFPGIPDLKKRWALGINSDAFGPEGQDDQEKVSWIVIPSVPIEWLNMHENAFIERSNQDLKGYFLDSFQSSLLRQMWFTKALETLTEPFETNEICSIGTYDILQKWRLQIRSLLRR